METSTSKHVREINTDEAYELLRQEFRTNQGAVALLMIFCLGVVTVAAPVLVWLVPKDQAPAVLKPLLNPYAIIFIAGIPALLLLGLSPIGREARNFRGVGSAINALERARAYHEKWREKHRVADLKECREYLLLAEGYLHDVPMFKRIQTEINTALNELSE